MKKANMPNPVKSLGHIKCYSLTSPRPVKSPGNSIRFNCHKIYNSRSTANHPKGRIALGHQQAYYFKVFQRLSLTTERRVIGWWFLVVDLSPTFLTTGTTDETFQKPGKRDSFRHILKRSASRYKFLGSQFFRSTTGI